QKWRISVKVPTSSNLAILFATCIWCAVVR
ncbi:cyclic nucleotide-binding domain protein, partial [Vibrio parahaemolyticus V-223/04]